MKKAMVFAWLARWVSMLGVLIVFIGIVALGYSLTQATILLLTSTVLMNIPSSTILIILSVVGWGIFVFLVVWWVVWVVNLVNIWRSISNDGE